MMAITQLVVRDFMTLFRTSSEYSSSNLDTLGVFHSKKSVVKAG